MGIYYTTLLLGGVAQAYNLTTWRPKQEDCQQFEASLSYSMKSYLKLTKKHTVGCVEVRWHRVGGCFSLSAMLSSRTEHRWLTLVTGTLHTEHFVRPRTFLYIYVWECQKDKVGLCAALYNPSARRAVRDSQSELASSISSLASVESLRTPASMNTAENNWGRCMCTHMDPYTYQHSRHTYTGKTW